MTEENTTQNTTQNTTPTNQSAFATLSKKFTIPPPPKTIADGVKRDYILVGGLAATIVALSAGVWNHSKGGSQITTNRLLKGRIWAQAFTVCAMGWYAFAYQRDLDEEEAAKHRKVILT